MKILKQLFFVLTALVVVQPEGKAVDNAPKESVAPLVLDLTAFYTKQYVKSNAPGYAGQKIIDGVPLHIGGEIVFESMGEPGPREIRRRVERKFDELHLVHAAKSTDAQGQTIALVRFHYADGTTNEIPLRYGGQVRNWQRLLSEEKETLTDPGSKICYRGPGKADPTSTSRLFKSTVMNPMPKKVVATIDFVSTREIAGYVLYAATVANSDAKRPVTPSVPSGEAERTFDTQVNVRVLDSVTRKPIEGAYVYTIDIGGRAGECPAYSSAKGEAVLRFSSANIPAAVIMLSVVKEGWETESMQVDLEAGTTNTTEIELSVGTKITGTVRDASGNPAGGVELMLFPNLNGRREIKTDAKGRFEAFFASFPDIRHFGNSGGGSLLIARDVLRNLVAVQDFDESVTNYNLNSQTWSYRFGASGSLKGNLARCCRSATSPFRPHGSHDGKESQRGFQRLL